MFFGYFWTQTRNPSNIVLTKWLLLSLLLGLSDANIYFRYYIQGYAQRFLDTNKPAKTQLTHMIKLSKLASILRNHFNVESISVEARGISGGDIHTSMQLNLSGHPSLPRHLFAKTNTGFGAEVLKSEFESLTRINTLISGLYPKARMYYHDQDDALLLMDFHNLISLSTDCASDAGQALANQHRLTSEKFGWASDNYIGLTPQPNKWATNWPEFFRTRRLLPMLEMAQARGLPEIEVQRAREVASGLDECLSHKVVPSLVHGDLWSGNLGFDRDNKKPLLFDPAPYYGDREVDIAMTELFGRQSDAFYQAYERTWPLEVGYKNRRSIYNLYHSLNHVVLFGSSYHGLVKHCLDQV